MGEVPAAIAAQESLMRWITSVNVACGGHAGDEHTMTSTVEQALRWKRALGAHPGYPDRVHFGRKEMDLSSKRVRDFVFEQVRALADIAHLSGATLTHVKPHGALYNQAVHRAPLAEAIAAGVARWNRDVVLVGLAGSPMLEVFRAAGFAVAAEAFADRRYEANGTLRSREFDDALIGDAAHAAEQALSIVQRGTVIARGGFEVAVHADTICIHGDTPGAVEIAAAVSRTLRDADITLRSLAARRKEK
jgi:UPF0271 protein